MCGERIRSTKIPVYKPGGIKNNQYPVYDLPVKYNTDFIRSLFLGVITKVRANLQKEG
jgi:hypothetical protein